MNCKFMTFLLQKMREIRAWIMKEENHRESNSLIVTVICHGNEHGDLLDKNKTLAWNVELFVQDLNLVSTLVGKPKILVIQSCRGSKYVLLLTTVGLLSIANYSILILEFNTTYFLGNQVAILPCCASQQKLWGKFLSQQIMASILNSLKTQCLL